MTFLELKNLTKTFGSCRAFHQINIAIGYGEVHAILGENGAGKSTLMKTIYGEHAPDLGGEIYLRGEKVNITSTSHAISLGIGMVHQHFRLVRPFSVLQNIVLGIEPRKFGLFIDYQLAREKIESIMKEFNFYVDLDAKIESLSVGTQQRVEILKLLYRNAELLILDEPTAVLTPQEIKDFYLIIKNLKSKGKTILIITHKLHEIKEIADKCTIIRKGEFITTLIVKNSSEQELASKMVGREVNLHVAKSKAKPTELKSLEISNLVVLNSKIIPAVKNFSLKLKPGFITGLAGIDGNGQSELVKALTGLMKVNSGTVTINNKNITNLSPLEIYQNKLGMIPEDRQRVGLVLDFSIQENLVLQKIGQAPFSKYGFILTSELATFAKKLIERFDIRPTDPEAKAQTLSGGNQQKIILAREIEHNPEVLIAFQPTRGLDVGAIEYIHKELIKLRDTNKAILLISYELDEILSLSDEIAVICEGTLTAYLDQEEIQKTENLKETLGFYMAGGVGGLK